MDRSAYYEGLKQLARDVREEYGLTSDTISLSSMRKVYRQEGIKIDYWPHKLRKVRGAYMMIDGESYVLVNRGIKPKEPRIFILAHELKHHLSDRDFANQRDIECKEVSWADRSPMEIGAEIFAAEFIYPEAEFLSLAENMGLTDDGCEPEDVVRLKKNCPAPVSYTFLVKRLEWFKIVEPGTFRGVQFQNLEEKMFGEPIYKQLRRQSSNSTR